MIGVIFFGMILLFLDFLSKAYVFHLHPFNVCSAGICSSEPLFSLFGIDFMISFATNRGAAWGLFANFQTVLMTIRILIVLGLLAYLFFINDKRGAIIPLVLIISGAAGNIVDFFLYGYVIDFFDFNLWGYAFPVFNLADTWITLGVIWLFLLTFFVKKEQTNGY